MTELKLIILLFIAFLPSLGNADGIGFRGQGENSVWSIDGVSLNADYWIPTTGISEYLAIESPTGGTCNVKEEEMQYYHAELTLEITDKFIGSNTDLLGQSTTLNIVFSRRADLTVTIDLPNIIDGGFSVRYLDRNKLDALSVQQTHGAENITGFVQALFSAKYYDMLYRNQSTQSADRAIANNNRFIYARMAANFLHQQHASLDGNGFFNTDPIVLPDGDAYTLLIKILTDASEKNSAYMASRNTILDTRYRSFWFFSDRLKRLYKSHAPITQEFIDAAESISKCVLQADGLKQLDPLLYSYLAQRDFYVPSNEGGDTYDLSREDAGLNIWRLIHNYRYGTFPRTISNSNFFLDELFKPIN